MVLGFGSRKKKGAAEPVFIRASPSLPELAQQRIPWPENLIDSNVVYEAPPVSEGHAGARKTSFHATRGPAIPFHKPFRGDDAPVADGGAATGNGAPAPPSAFGARGRASSHPFARARSTRRARHAPTFNVMVAGAKRTGKTALLRLLLDTSALAPANTAAQLAALAAFRAGGGRATRALGTACVEIVQPPPAGRAAGPEDRVTLTCIDTPGLDFGAGRELALNHAVAGLVRYVDLQFAETLGEESKVVRASRGDQHVHLCIYLIDPDSVMTPSARRAKSQLAGGFHIEPVSPAEAGEASEYGSGSEDDAEDGAGGERRAAERLAMAPAEIGVVARLAKRVNVLPVVARADTLTDGRLARIKRAVRRDLRGVGVGADADAEGVLAVWDADAREDAGAPNGSAGADAEEEGAGARPVIKLRDRAAGRGLVRSRSRRSLKAAVGAEDEEPAGEDGAPSRRTSVGSTATGAAPAGAVAAGAAAAGAAAAAAAAAVYNPVFSRAELRARMPFAIIAPERAGGRGRAETGASSENGHAAGPGAGGEGLEGRFVRRFRWGTVDVLDPQHCDYAALRSAVLGSYMRALKATTKDVLYERFRTEKLLARRATRNISADDRKRILHDLEL